MACHRYYLGWISGSLLFDKDATHQLGDLKGKPFKEIWHSKEYIGFRSKILQGRKNIDICANCSEGTKVWG
jgi:hypothetical protein